MAVGSNSGSGLSVRAANVLHNLGIALAARAGARSESGTIPKKRTGPRPVVARMLGRCARCDGVITPGMRIEKIVTGWMHEDCPGDEPDDHYADDPNVGDHGDR
jgi:hypothetical protein